MRRAAILLLTLAAPGCGPARTDLVASGDVVARGPDASPASPPDPAPEVVEEDGGLVVAGRVFARSGVWPTSVEVTVTAPDGSLLHRAMAETTRRPGPQPVDRLGHPLGPRTAAPDAAASYRVRFPTLPPRGSTVSVRRTG